ncbi:FAD binding domain-containing protein, partial [Chloroflexota bacterium]
YINGSSSSVLIGALTTHRAIETSPLINQRFPILVEMEQQLASLPIRNWGTIGGNVCHADPASDPPLCLIALGAKVKLRSIRGEREVPMGKFFVDYFESVLEPDEIMVEVEIPNMPPNTGAVFIKETETAGGMVIVATGAMITLDSDTVTDIRIVLGGVGSTPFRAKKTEKALLGKRLSAFEEAAAVAAGEVNPVTDVHGSVEYRRHLVNIITKMALGQAAKRAQRL